MYPVGYLVLMANLQNLITKDRHSDVQVGSFRTLQKDLELIPNMPLQGFKDTGLQRNDNFGVYISKNLRDYIFKGEGNENDEGVIIKLFYKPQPKKPYDPNLLAYFLHRDTLGHDVKEKVNEFILNYGNRRRNSKTMEENLSDYMRRD